MLLLAATTISCGTTVVEDPGGLTQIVGGTNAYYGEFPWQVFISIVGCCNNIQKSIKHFFNKTQLH